MGGTGFQASCLFLASYGAAGALQGYSFFHPFTSMQDCTKYILEILFAFRKTQEIGPTSSEGFSKLRVSIFFFFLPVKSQIVNILGFVGHAVATTQLCLRSMESAIDNT